MATGDKLVNLDSLKTVYDTSAKFTAPTEASSTASAAHAIGEHFIYNGVLYIATTDIASGATITPNTNCLAVPSGIGGEVSELKSALRKTDDGFNSFAYALEYLATFTEAYAYYECPVANGTTLILKTVNGGTYEGGLILYNSIKTQLAVVYPTISGNKATAEINVDNVYYIRPASGFTASYVYKKSTGYNAEKKINDLMTETEGLETNITELQTGKQDKLTFDYTPTQNSTNPVTSNGVYNAIQGKQNVLTIDDNVSQSSSNPVKSSGIYTAIHSEESRAIAAEALKVNKPTISPNGTQGQILRTNGDGTTEWANVGLPTDEQTASAVEAWLNVHPEATTTVLDGSLTKSKFSDALKLETLKDYATPQMYGATCTAGHDDASAINQCISENSNIVFLPGTYNVSESVIVGSYKRIIFMEGAKIVPNDDFDVLVFSGTGGIGSEVNDVEIYDLCIDVSECQVFTSTAVLFGPDKQHLNIKLFDIKLYGFQRTASNIEPYDDFTAASYPHGIGIRFLKTLNYASNIRFIRPFINGFTTAFQMYVGPKIGSNPAPWITEIYVSEFLFGNMGHALEISNNWIDDCSFNGFVQCRAYAGNQKYWAIYGGTNCRYNVKYWDSNKKWFFVPSDARTYIDKNARDRYLCDDFGKTIYIGNCSVESGKNNSNAVCLNDYMGKVSRESNTTIKIEQDGINNIYMIAKDKCGNYLIPAKGGTKNISFDLLADFNGKASGYLKQVQRDYLNYDSFFLYQPAYTIVSAEGNTIVLDNVNGLSENNRIGIWGFNSTEYGYPLVPGGYMGMEGYNYQISGVDPVTNTITLTTNIPDTTGFAGKQVSKLYKGTYITTGGILFSANTLTHISQDIPILDSADLIYPDYFNIGALISNLSGQGNGTVYISNIVLTY